MTPFWIAVSVAALLFISVMFIVRITRRMEAEVNRMHQDALKEVLSQFLEARKTLQDVPSAFFDTVKDEDYPALMNALSETPRWEAMPAKVISELVGYFKQGGGKREKQLVAVFTDEKAYADLVRLMGKVVLSRQSNRW